MSLEKDPVHEIKKQPADTRISASQGTKQRTQPVPSRLLNREITKQILPQGRKSQWSKQVDGKGREAAKSLSPLLIPNGLGLFPMDQPEHCI